MKSKMRGPVVPFFLLLFVPCILATHACNNVDITSEWGDGLTADLHAGVDHNGHGWEILLTFDKTLSSLECWQGTVSSTDSKTFKIVNSDEDISSGGTLELHTLWHFSSKPQLIAAFRMAVMFVVGDQLILQPQQPQPQLQGHPQQPHLAYLLVPQLPPYQQPRLIMATSQIIHQNMIM